jgi:hypothetical protein
MSEQSYFHKKYGEGRNTAMSHTVADLATESSLVPEK